MFKFILFFSLFFTLKAEAISCRFWVRGFPDPNLGSTPLNCTQSSLSLPSSIQLYYVDSLRDEPLLTQKLDAVAEALRRAHLTYLRLGDLPPVKAILYDRPRWDDVGNNVTFAFAFTSFYNSHESCPIIVYPPSYYLDENHLKQSVSHELFHCFQKHNFPGQVLWGTNHATYAWWLEGSAQFFSNLVYPEANFEYHSMFEEYVPTNPLPEQNGIYKTVYFFQSHYNHSGQNAQATLELLNHMPTSATSQSLALQRVPDMKNLFHDFTKDMVDHQVTDSDGNAAPTPHVSKSPIRLNTNASQTIDLVTRPFALTAFRVTVPEKGRYRFEIRNSDGTKVSFKLRRANWELFPLSLETKCFEEDNFDIAISSVNGPLPIDSAQLVVTREERDDCGCEIGTHPTDSCLFGTWELEHSSMQDFFGRVTSGSPVQWVGSSGSFKVHFNQAGEILWTVDNLRIDTRMEMRNATMEMNQVSNGSMTSIYVNNGQTRMCARNTNLGVTCEQTISTNGRSIKKPCANPVIMPAMEFTYECRESTLIYKTAIGVRPDGGDMEFNYIFHKI